MSALETLAVAAAAAPPERSEWSVNLCASSTKGASVERKRLVNVEAEISFPRLANETRTGVASPCPLVSAY